MLNMKIVPSSPEHEACRQALCNAIKPYAHKLGAQGMLAVASALVGQLIALQDQRSLTPAGAMEIVLRNIESANQEVMDSMGGPVGGNA